MVRTLATSSTSSCSPPEARQYSLRAKRAKLTDKSSSTIDNGGFNGIGASAQGAVLAEMWTEPAPEINAAESEAHDPVEEVLADLFGSDHEVIPVMKAVLKESRRKRQIMQQALLLGMFYYTYLKKKPPRVGKESGIEWVEKTLGNETSCYNMFRMNPPVFEMLHDVLVQSYGLKSTNRMSSRESLGMFLWMIGTPKPVRQAEDKFTRSMETISRKFEHVLECVCTLAKDIIRPRDPTFSTVHPKIANHKYAPFFNNAIGAIDGTHVKVIMPGTKVGPYFSRSKEKGQNVLAICDFDRRFMFVAAGILGSAHDWTVLQEALQRYSDNFPHPPLGKFYLVDSGYLNRPGYLAPYKGV